MTIRVLVADDQAMIRGALAGLLNLERDIEVVAQAADGVQALEELTRLATQDASLDAKPTSSARPASPADVAIVDIEMPHMDGITTTEAIRARFSGVRVLIVTTFGRPGYLQRALDAGATGFMVKNAPVEALAEGVRTLAAGGRAIDQSLAVEALSTGSSSLTQREADVLREVERGGTIADIARTLGLSQGTVRNHVSSAMLKMEARTRAEAASLARAAGWL
ncbi:response regulator transcription factor [Actinomyces sp. Marseille-QA0893]